MDPDLDMEWTPQHKLRWDINGTGARVDPNFMTKIVNLLEVLSCA